MKNATGLILYTIIIILGLFAHHRIVKKALEGQSEVTEEHLQNVMRMHEEQIYDDLRLVVDSLDTQTDTLALLNNASERHGYSFYVFTDDHLRAWSNATIPMQNLSPESFAERIINTNNGWYYVIDRQTSRSKVFAAFRIKANYYYENEYLPPEFDPSFGISSQSSIFCYATISDCCKIYGTDGRYLFSIEPRGAGKLTLSQQIADISVLIIVVLLIIVLISRATNLALKHFNSIAVMVVLAIVLCTIYLGSSFVSIAPPMSEWFLFSSQVFAYGREMQSLAHAFYAAILLLLYCHFLHYTIAIKFPLGSEPHAMRRTLITSTIAISAVGVLFLIINKMIDIIFIHSSDLSIYIGEIDISGSSITKIIILSLLFVAYCITITAIYVNISKVLTVTGFTIALSVSVLLIIIEQALVEESGINWTIVVTQIVFNVPFYVKKRHDTRRLVFSRFIWFTFAASVFFIIRLTMLNSEKESFNHELMLKTISFRMILEDDPIAEQFLNENEEKIATDSTVQVMLSKRLNDTEKSTRIYDYLREHYLNGYLNRFDVQVMVCSNENSKLTMTGSIDDYNCFDYFHSMIEQYGKPLHSKSHFYNLDDNDGRVEYFGEFDYDDGSHVYIELTQQTQNQPYGYPALLTNRYDIIDYKQLKDYSYAKYCDGTLYNYYGEYEYPRKDFFSDEEEEVRNGYLHKIFIAANNQKVVVSYPQMTFSRIASDYSFLFIGMLIVSMLVIFFMSKNGDLLYGQMSIHERIQFTFILFLLSLLVVFCTLTGYNTYTRYETQQHEQMKMKLASVNEAVLQEICYMDNETTTDNILQRISSLFQIDVHLFSPDGMLRGTSRRELFTNGVSAPLINSEALERLRTSNSYEQLSNERIGNLVHYSLYAPLFDANDNLLAYVNLPYFDDIQDMRSKIFSALMPVTNSYMIIILLAIFISYSVALRITRPLVVISNRIKRVSLQNVGEKIEYNNPDEIGALVNEYNRMLDELERSAEQLAMSERESTWREMARQISHEIRNPLTPMKLSVQYMQRAWDEKRPDFETMFKKTTRTLSEQIDQLSFIASQFSNLAKTPNGDAVYVDVVERAENSVVIFNNTENASVTLTNKVQTAIVLINPDQLTSVFNNLIKNALQSGHGDEFIDVRINIDADDEYVYVSVADNGRGIDPEVQGKIFKPNFTTKSTGMGLGLAIVRNIIVGAKGEIFFETKLNEGTTFFVKLPLVVVN